MKELLFATMAFCIMLLSCSFSSQRERKQGDFKDTVVCSEQIPRTYKYNDCEYFVVIGKDTSAYSCLITSNLGKCITFDLKFSSIKKYFSRFGLVDENDTTAVTIRKGIEPQRKFRTPCYKDLLHEIELCFEVASKNLDLSTLHGFHSFLSDLGDIAVLTTNNLNLHFTKRKYGLYDHSDIRKALMMTSFFEDFNRILNKSGLEVEEITCEEMRNILKKDNYLNYANISKGINIPDSIMDVEVFVSIKKLENKN